MKKIWSIATAVRNPERIRSFLMVLKQMEGEKWDRPHQRKFQIMLIQNKVYGAGNPQFYKGLTQKQIDLLDNPKPLTFQQAEEMLDRKKYEGGGDMRGRQSFNPIEKMGLANVDRDGNLRITSLGKYLAREDYDLGEMFFKSFLKWQLPNPLSRDFKTEDGYNIKPFVGTLHFIRIVNRLCKNAGQKEKGISMVEFSIFVPTLIHWENIKEHAKLLLQFREGLEQQDTQVKKRHFINAFVTENFKDFENATLNNLKEYSDNIWRYFRMTRYFHARGEGYYVDLEPRRAVEIEALLEADDASSRTFDQTQYEEYIADINLPELPWETPTELKKIAVLAIEDVKQYQADLQKRGVSLPPFSFKDVPLLDKAQLKMYIEELRSYRRELQQREDHYSSQSVASIKEYIAQLQDIRNLNDRASVELERLSALALNAINDALAIKPNYPVGDDNQPTFTAPANKPDIECFYTSFNGVCEVTMLTTRAQWVSEGQPVMRHLRDFEDANNTKQSYCLFVAPALHRDTVNTFWTAVKYEYEGKKQNIIPITIGDLIKLLEAVIAMKEKGGRLEHKTLLELYHSIIEATGTAQSSTEWAKSIPTIIEKWRDKVTA
jgi:hypothetical protein